MKTYIKILAVTILTSAFVFGCDLERLPYDQITIETPDETSATTITLGSYFKLKEEYFYKSLHYVGEYGGDNVSLSGTTSDKFFFLYNYQRQKDNYYPGRVWQFTYQTIVNVNNMIEILPENKSQGLDYIIGENYFIRGYLYFSLGNVFGRPYSQNPSVDLSVPLKLTADVKDYPERATVKKVYDQVVKDLIKASQLMNVTDNNIIKNNCYASREAALALLSRVHLYMGNWEEAERCADTVLMSTRFDLLQGSDYSSYPTFTPESNKETIFAIRNMKDKDYEKYHMQSYSVGSMYSKINNHGWGEMYPSAPYLELIHQNPSDLRANFIKDQELGGGKEWIIYVKGSEATKIYTYVTNAVEKVGDDYKLILTINEDGKVDESASKPEDYTTELVQKEVVNGETKYFVTRKDDNKKYYVRLEKMVEKRNGYPMRYIYKCSLQEGQPQLWSPVILRLAEMYLNRAEARAQQGNDAGAISDINVLRKRATIPEWTVGGLPEGKSVLNVVMEERRLELAFEGHRRLDIYRHGESLNRQYPGTHLSGTNSFTTISPDNNVIVEFIPQDEMDAYPIELVQNP